MRVPRNPNPGSAHLVDRRKFIRDGARVAASATLAGALLARLGYASFETAEEAYDFVIVGSGAGGGVLANRLVREGFQVLIIEAGDKPLGPSVEVPGLNLNASAEPALNWNFFVRHFTDSARHGKRWKTTNPLQTGILYPRASAIGGCTEHHVMLMMPPAASEWEKLSTAFKDPSWSPALMRKYYERVRSWLPIQFADPTVIKDDPVLTAIVAGAAAKTAGMDSVTTSHLNVPNQGPVSVTSGIVNPLDWEQVLRPKEGLCLIPQSIRNGKRFGIYDLLKETQAQYPGKLTILTGSLATRVVMEPGTTKSQIAARGVEILRRPNAYRASPLADPSASVTPQELRVIRARKEVILCAGTYNTPQLLMLSGMGREEELKRLEIPVKVSLPGVGRNLQDRYELSVVRRFAKPFALTRDCHFDGSDQDPCMKPYRANPDHSAYGTNGVLFGMKLKSHPSLKEPDLFLFGAPARFEGYEPGFAQKATEDPRHFTWAVLKAYARNRSGTVTLRSTSPLDPPTIEFRYFSDHALTQSDGQWDLEAVRYGVRFARELAADVDRTTPLVGNPSEEIFPGPAIQTDVELGETIAKEAWGHHASCSCKMGTASDPDAVVTPDFRVKQTENLRIVDASVFPEIPGFYIAMPIFIIAEKAADEIARHWRAT